MKFCNAKLIYGEKNLNQVASRSEVKGKTMGKEHKGMFCGDNDVYILKILCYQMYAFAKIQTAFFSFVHFIMYKFHLKLANIYSQLATAHL